MIAVLSSIFPRYYRPIYSSPAPPPPLKQFLTKKCPPWGQAPRWTSQQFTRSAADAAAVVLGDGDGGRTRAFAGAVAGIARPLAGVLGRIGQVGLGRAFARV